MRRVLLLVDTSYQTYRACAAHRDLSWFEEYTGGLYGFMQMLQKAIRETEATSVVFCLDSKPYIRSLEYPAYKRLRGEATNVTLNEVRELYAKAEPQVLEFARVCGIPVWGIPGFESDDLIAHAALHVRSRFDRVYAVANDSDLFQLLTLPNFAIYWNNIGDVWTCDRLWDKHKLTPAQYTLATALQGTHNDVEGIPQVGEKRSRAAVLDAALMRQYRSKWSEVIDRNLALIKLPHAEFPRSSTIPRRIESFSRHALYRYATRYGIQVSVPMVNSFEQIAKEM